jgi:hypothetical protein
MRTVLSLLSLIFAIGCRASPSIEKIAGDGAPSEESSAAIRVLALERRAAKLGTEWQDVEEGYATAADDFHRAEQAYATAQREANQAVDQFRQATAHFEAAQQKWRYYQALVVAAAAIDAHNLDQFRTATGARHLSNLNCSENMSTAAFRRILIAAGENLTGLDVDHIVPKSLGGADNPANYRLLPASENRSLGNVWDRSKCLSAAKQCAGAVAVSRKCGTFRGTGL